MTMLFTNYDRTHMCDHEGVLGRKAEDGTRMCMRCGKTIQPQPEPEHFTGPARRELGRRATTTTVR